MALMLDAALKAQQWEIAKGHLRAAVALQGSYPSGENDQWEHFRDATEAFIAEVEDNGWQE